MGQDKKWYLINGRYKNIFLAVECPKQDILAIKIGEIKYNLKLERKYNRTKPITTRWELTEKIIN